MGEDQWFGELTTGVRVTQQRIALSPSPSSFDEPSNRREGNHKRGLSLPSKPSGRLLPPLASKAAGSMIS